MSPPNFQKILSVLLVSTLFLLLLSFAVINNRINIFTQTNITVNALPNNIFTFTSSKKNDAKCNVLSGMTQGTWKTRPLSIKENKDITTFLTHSHAHYRYPGNYQRTDKLCGNVTHTGSATATWFRALCDPTGSTPCCYNNRCAMKTVEECVCKDCYDLRNMKHGEYSSWIPSHPGCPYKDHSPREACDILNGSTIMFIGDSLVRHVYTAMLLVVTGNMKDGAMKKNVRKDQRTLCKGMYMFTEKQCRLLLKPELRACNGTVKLKLFYYYSAGFGPRVKAALLPLQEKSLVFIGIGIHNYFDHKNVQDKYLLPSLNYTKNRKWPRFLWAANHAPGMLKSPIVLSQTYDSVKRFNAKMEPFLKSWNIPIFETFNLTDGMMSFDGEHYGMGVNVVKANILLSYIKDIRNKQKW